MRRSLLMIILGLVVAAAVVGVSVAASGGFAGFGGSRGSGAASGPPPAISGSPPMCFTSSSDLSNRLSACDAPTQNGSAAASSGAGTSTWRLAFDDTEAGARQKVRGFGAAVTDSTVTMLNQLPADQLSDLLEVLMTSRGANFALMRHSIGASDMSADPVYSYDDNDGAADPDLDRFSLGDQGTAMASLLARMRALQPDLTILGSVWSPAGWMKQNGVMAGDATGNNLNHDYEAAYGQYFVRYLQAYAGLGATVDAITIQNEPLNSQAGFPTMYVGADEAGGLIDQHVGPALEAAKLGVRIWAYDHNTDVPSYPQTVLDSASAYIGAVAWHCYATNNDWAVLTAFHTQNPTVEQVMTECWTSSTSTDWNQAAEFTLGPLQNWATGALAWALATDQQDGPHLAGGCSTCRGIVTVDPQAGTYQLQVDFYMLAQFSRFIPVGATVLAPDPAGSSSSGGGGVVAVATLNPDGTRTVVMENQAGNRVYVTVTMRSGDTWGGLVEAKSVTTWVLPGAKAP